jgi:hypothetical protein
VCAKIKKNNSGAKGLIPTVVFNLERGLISRKRIDVSFAYVLSSKIKSFCNWLSPWKKLHHRFARRECLQKNLNGDVNEFGV